MLDETRIINKMKERGFREYRRYETGDTIQSIIFISGNTIRNRDIYCTVTLANGHFDLEFVVPNSMHQLISKRHGFVMDDDYFDEIYSEFQPLTEVLNNFVDSSNKQE